MLEELHLRARKSAGRFPGTRPGYRVWGRRYSTVHYKSSGLRTPNPGRAITWV